MQWINKIRRDLGSETCGKSGTGLRVATVGLLAAILSAVILVTLSEIIGRVLFVASFLAVVAGLAYHFFLTFRRVSAISKDQNRAAEGLNGTERNKDV